MKFQMFVLLCLVAGLTDSTDCLGQKITITVQVREKQNATPISEALISFIDANGLKRIGGKTDNQGHLNFNTDAKPGAQIKVTAGKSDLFAEETVLFTVKGKPGVNEILFQLSAPENKEGKLLADTTLRSIYAEPNFGDQLYRYDAQEEVESKIRALCKVDNIAQDFEMVASNVTSVAVIIDGSKRYLLYSTFFFWSHEGDLSSQYLVLAHAVAHLAKQNTLQPQRRIFEEIVADEKAAKLLYKIQNIGEGTSYESFKEALATVPFGYSEVLPANRMEAFNRGWAVADGQLNSKKSAGFFLNEENVNNLPLPRFWLDGSPSLYKDNKNVFRNAINPSKTPTYGKADEVLQKALKGAGFQQWSYHVVNEGFALITQVEQFDDKSATAKSLSGDDRWRDTPPEESISSILGFFENIIWPRSGHFRFFVFVVSDKEVPKQKTDITINPKYVKDLLDSGQEYLAPSIAAAKFSTTSRVSVIVYEMNVPKSTLIGQEVSPPQYQPEKHLEGSGILSHLH